MITGLLLLSVTFLVTVPSNIFFVTVGSNTTVVCVTINILFVTVDSNIFVTAGSSVIDWWEKLFSDSQYNFWISQAHFFLRPHRALLLRIVFTAYFLNYWGSQLVNTNGSKVWVSSHGCGICCLVCVVVHLKEPLPLFEEIGSLSCGGMFRFGPDMS